MSKTKHEEYPEPEMVSAEDLQHPPAGGEDDGKKKVKLVYTDHRRQFKGFRPRTVLCCGIVFPHGEPVEVDAEMAEEILKNPRFSKEK